VLGRNKKTTVVEFPSWKHKKIITHSHPNRRDREREDINYLELLMAEQ